MRIKHKFTLITLLIWNLAFSVSGDGNVVSERRVVNSFNSLSITGPFKIVFSNNPNNDFFLQVTADKNLQQYVTIDQIGLSVFVNIKPGIDISRFTQMVLHVDNRDIHKLTINTNSFQQSEGSIFSCDELHLKITGSTPIAFDIRTRKLYAEISNLNTTSLMGEVEETVILNNNNGLLSCFNLKSNTLRLKNSGNGSVEIYGDKQLEITNQNMGHVYYSGAGILTKKIEAISGSICKEENAPCSSLTYLSGKAAQTEEITNNTQIEFNTDSLFQVMMERDQRHRKSKQVDTINTLMEDAENFSCLKWYLNKYGYPDIKTDSLRVMFTTLFMHIDNCSNFLEIKDLLAKAVKDKKLQPNVYAYSYDRSLIASKKEPIFYYFPPGSAFEIQHKPLKEDLPKINKARKEIGLPVYPYLLNGKYF